MIFVKNIKSGVGVTFTDQQWSMLPKSTKNKFVEEGKNTGETMPKEIIEFVTKKKQDAVVKNNIEPVVERISEAQKQEVEKNNLTKTTIKRAGRPKKK